MANRNEIEQRLTEKQMQTLALMYEGGTGCADDMADQGLIETGEINMHYQRTRRMAMRFGIDPRYDEGWLGKLVTEVF